MSKENLLFICGNIMPYSSQGVRYINLLPELAKYFNITLLSYNDFYSSPEIRSVTIEKQRTAVNNNFQNTESTKSFAKSLYKKFLRPFVFPDRYKYAIDKYETEIKILFKKNEYQKVIIGMTPFSLYQLAPYLRKSYNSEVICDLSDPFSFNGSVDYAFIYFKEFLKRYEKKHLNFVHKVVVLNPTIQNLYLERFKHQKVFVIEQGLNKIQLPKSKSITKKCGFQLIYAGGLYKNFREAFELYKAIDSFNGGFRMLIYGNINSELLAQSTNCSYKGAIESNLLIEEYYKSDCIVFIDNNRGYQVPGKILEIQEIGRPILFIYSNPNSPTFEYLLNENIIIVKNTVAAIIGGLHKIQSIIGDSNRSEKLEDYYWLNLGSKYKALLND